MSDFVEVGKKMKKSRMAVHLNKLLKGKWFQYVSESCKKAIAQKNDFNPIKYSTWQIFQSQ